MEQHPQPPDSKPPSGAIRQMELAGKGNSQVWDLEDSGSDSEGFVKREVLDSKMAFSSSPPPATASTAPTSAAPSRMSSRDAGNVIDLTLDSDDEDQSSAAPPPQPSQSQSQSQRGRVVFTVRRDDPPPLQAPRHKRVETTPLSVLQSPPPSVPPLRMSTGPSSMPPPQPPTGSMLGKRRNRESDDDLRYRSPDERGRDYDRGERDYRYSHKAPRRENGDRSPPQPVYSPPSRVLPAINSERRPNGTSPNGYHNPNPSSSSSAFSHTHARSAQTLPPIQPRSSTYGYGGPYSRSPESSQSPTLPSPPMPPYYNNPASNESYRAAPSLPVRGGGVYNRRWEERSSWD